MLLLLLVGCVNDQDHAWRELPPPGVRACGVARAQVLYPRHRIISPVPPVHLVIPADPGPAVVSLVTDGGLKWTTRTVRRTIPWPRGTRVLRVGERGSVTVSSAAGRARAGFILASPGSGRRAYQGLESEIRRYLRHGLPMEALRLAAATGTRPTPRASLAALRAGFPRALLW